MIIRPGTALGPYEVIAPLDAGGMGSVFRGRDPRLNREVAIKVLPISATRDERRVKRFLREARAAAAVTHPNIVAIYDVGEAEVELPTPFGIEPVSLKFLVEEFVEGLSLRRLLRAGRPPLGRLVEIATGVARGLEAAHEKGLVHRDLKPENVVLDSRGTAKIADFGLVRFIYPDSAAPSDEPEEEVTETLTRTGFVVGTVGYMSPEQVRGEVVGPASDLFAYGIVLYEMLTGETPFSRSRHRDPFTAILREPTPSVLAAVPETPRRLAHVIERCLEKDQAKRYSAASRILVHLEEVRKELGIQKGTAASPRASAILPTVGAPLPPVPAHRVARRALFLAGGAVAVLVAFAGGLAVGRLGATRPREANGQTLFAADAWRPVPALADARGLSSAGVVLSGDGRRAAFVGNGEGSDAAVFVAGTAVAEAPRLVAGGFSTAGTPCLGGDGSLLFGATRSEERPAIWELPQGSPEPRRLVDDGEDPALSPDGKLLAFVRRSSVASELWLATRNGEKPSRLASAPGRDLRFPSFTADGAALLFVDAPQTGAEGDAGGLVFTAELSDPRIVPWGTGTPVDATTRPVVLSDGSVLVLSAADRSALLLDPRGEKGRRLPFGAGLSALAATPDGSTVLTRAGNGPATLWRRRPRA